MKILMVAASQSDPASRFRIYQWAPHLRKLGHEVRISPANPGHFWKPARKKSRYLYWSRVYLAAYIRYLSRLPLLLAAKKYDLVFMNRPLVPEHWITGLERVLVRRNSRLVFDFDDAIHLVGANEPKISKIIASAAWVTPGNAYLEAYALAHNPRVRIIPTVVDTDMYKPGLGRPESPVRIGWSGSSYSLPVALPMIKAILAELKPSDRVQFVIIADPPAESMLADLPVTFIPWTEKTEVEAIQQIDIGLMPLNDSPFERGKCGLKLVQYMAAGLPSVASPVGVNSTITLHGETGFLAPTLDDWLVAINKLLSSQELRLAIGSSARRRVESHYSVKAVLPDLLGVFEKTLAWVP